MGNAFRMVAVVGGVLLAGGVLQGADAPAGPPAAPPAEATAVPAVPPPVEVAPAVSAEPVPPPAAPKPEPFRAVTVWSGAIVEVTLTAEPQKWRDMDALLKENRLKPEDGLDKPVVERSPAEGKQYAILTMKLREKRSIGKADYNLRVNGTDCPCLALGTESTPFDPRVWEYRHAPGADEVMLVFEIPSGAVEGVLVAGLPVTVSQPDAPIKLVVEAAPVPLVEPPPAAPVEVPPVAPAAAVPAAEAPPVAPATVPAAPPAAPAAP